MKLHAYAIAVCATALSITLQLTAAHEKPRAVVTGTIVDTFQGRITDATVTLSAGGHKYRTATMPNGEYTISVNPGVYEIRVTRPGFCDGRRGAFVLRTGIEVSFDFELLVCGSVDPITIQPNDVGAAAPPPPPDRYQYQELSAVGRDGLRPLVLFGNRDDHDDSVSYSSLTVLNRHFPVVYTYNLLTIKAETLMCSKKDNSVRGFGSVTWQEGKVTKHGPSIELTFPNGEPHVDLAN